MVEVKNQKLYYGLIKIQLSSHL